MRRLIVISLLALFLTVPSHSLAAEKAVWYTPAESTTGQIVTLHAFVYNDTNEALTATVAFRVGEQVLATGTAFAEAGAAVIASASGPLPAKGTILTAEITGATNAAKVETDALNGVVDTLIVGSRQADPFGDGALKDALDSVLAVTEPIRLKYAERFVAMRDAKRTEAGVVGNDSLENVINDRQPETPAAPNDEIPKNSLGQYYTKGGVNFLDYGALIGLSVMAGLFSTMIGFYVTVLFVAFLVLRFISRLIF